MEKGTQLGRYVIEKLVGKGGMGEVYLAHDEQLDRKVALKILLPEFCCDLERVARFKLEAKAASALNHPHIITIYEVGEDCEQLYIATEFVDGETLRHKIESGELTHLEAVRVAEQIADALAVAHEAKIVHRDIKPENVMVRRDGIVKILDFGLAKPIFRQKVGKEDATVQIINTQPGIVMGSVRYMSPEQARGKDTDERTDVWSLGVVLYEMLTGKNPFEGETVSDSMAAVIHIEPAAIEDVPEELQRILRKSLKKKASDRYQSIKDFALDLRDLRSEPIHHSAENRLSQFAKTVSVKRHDTSENETLIHHTLSAENETVIRSRENLAKKSGLRFLPVGILALALVLALGGWFVLPKLFGRVAPDFNSIQASLLTQTGNAHSAEISPDGRFAAFITQQDGRRSLVVKQIAAGTFLTIVQPTLMEFHQPAFTPDGEFIYYVEVDKGVGTLYKISQQGGERTKIAFDVDSKVTFSPDGKRLAFIRHNPTEGGDTIFTANADGANIEPFLQTKDAGYNQFAGIDWSPDGKRLLVSVLKKGGEMLQKQEFITVEMSDKKLIPFGEKSWFGLKSFEWLKDGSGVVLIGKASTEESAQVWFYPFPEGAARQITTDTSDYASISVSANGNSIIATRVDTISSFWSHNPQTREMKQLTSESKTLLGHAGISQTSDGKILFTKDSGKEVNIFSMDENGTGEKQLTSAAGINVNPVASPDGKYIFFSSNRNAGIVAVWRMNADGSEARQITFPENAFDGNPQFSPDGKTLFFMRQTMDGGRAKILKVSAEGGETSALNTESNQSEYFPRISPDGKKIAYRILTYDSATSNFDTGIRIVGLTDGKIDNSVKPQDLKINPFFVWSPDSKSLTYINKAGIDNLWNIALEDKKEKPLTDFTSSFISNFLWSRDGKKLFIVRAIYNSDLVLIKDSTKS